MPLNAVIVHPRIWQCLNNFFPARCTIQGAVADPRTQNSIGELTNPFADLAGHIGLRCNLASAMAGQDQQSEVRREDTTYVSKRRNCQLDGYYPLITEEMRASVDGVTYDIRGVVHLSIQKATKLILEIVT